MPEARIIKRYANRKLYDTEHSCYVTLDQIGAMIRHGDDVKVVDNKTKEDLTTITLAQIIYEEEKKQHSFLPLGAMRNIIQDGGRWFAEAQRRVQRILPRRNASAANRDPADTAPDPFAEVAGPRDVFVEVHVEYDQDRPQRLRELLLAAGATASEAQRVSNDDRGTLQRFRVTTPDLASWHKVRVVLADMPGLHIVLEEDAITTHHRQGAIEITSRIPLSNDRELAAIDLPEVARVASAIAKAPDLVRDWTCTGDAVAVVSNGSSIGAMGSLGPLASLPLLESRSAAYQQLGGVNAIPLALAELDPRRLAEAIITATSGFAAIHLEGIQSHDAFAIKESLERRTKKPVIHAEQHATAVAVTAGIMRIARRFGLELSDCDIGQVGLGAAGTGIVRLLAKAGVRRLWVHDDDPRTIERVRETGAIAVDRTTLFERSKIAIIAARRPGALDGVVIRPGQILLTVSAPKSSITAAEALAAGAAYATDARIANVLIVLPGLLRGLLDARASVLDQGALLAAAWALAAYEPALEWLDPLDRRIHESVRRAVAHEVGS